MKAKEKKELVEMIGKIEEMSARVREIADAEQEAYEALGDRARAGVRGQKMQETAEQLGEVSGQLTEIACDIDNITAEG